jgi:hypothetical protein
VALVRRLVAVFRGVVEHARRTPRSRWWTTFGLASILCLSWAIATPLFAAPDEPAHVVRAASIARGTITGEVVRQSTPAERGAFRPIDFNGAYRVRLPEIFRSAYTAGCFAFQADKTANCASFRGSDRNVDVLTTAGGQPPAYYAVVGILSRPFPNGTAMIYYMRLVSALMTCALLASAIASLERTARPALAYAGAAVAITPMVLFLGGVVNPSGMEIAAALCVWTSGAALAREAALRIDRRLVARLTVGAGALALARPLGPFWLALIGIALLSISAREGWARIWTSRPIRIGALVVATCSVAQVAWIASVGTLNTATTNTVGINLPWINLTRGSIGMSFTRFEQMIGVFGWLDTKSPGFTLFLWILALGSVLTLAVLVGHRRLVAAATVLVGLTILVPIALEVPNVPAAGYFWQGRYTLPLAVGVPVLAGIAAAAARLSESLRVGRLLTMVGSALVVGQILAFMQALRRYTVGVHGALLFWRHASWSPPVSTIGIVIVFALGYAAFVAWLFTMRFPREAALETTADRPAARPGAAREEV